MKVSFLLLGALSMHCLLAPISFGQVDRSPSEQLAKLKQDTEARGFNELMDSISKRDGGNFDVIFAISIDPCLVRAHSRFRGVLGDPRVRKLYELASSMPKAEAAARIEKAFKAKLKQYQSRGCGAGDAEQHGLHAALFLVSQFCDRDVFVQSYSNWVKWYRAQVSTEEYKKRFKQDDPLIDHRIAKSSFEMYSSPELLMSASLFLNDQVRQGKTVEEATAHMVDVFADAGFKGRLPSIQTVNLLPHDDNEAEPLASFTIFPVWAELGYADYKAHVELLTAIQNQLDPPSVVDRALQIAESAARDRNEKRALERRRAELDFKAGTKITFGGRDLKFRVFKVWAPNKSPDKKEMIGALDKMLKYKIPRRLQSNWTGPLDEAKKWINSIPPSGTEREQSVHKRWPEPTDDAQGGDADDAQQPDYWIELEIIDASSLSGPPPDDSDDHSKDHSK